MSQGKPMFDIFSTAKVEAMVLALQEIIEVASGDRQIGIDDTAGMSWVDKRARAALLQFTKAT